MNKKSHKWQSEAFAYFKEKHKCVLGAATGTGKTYIAIQIIKYVLESEPNIKCLIVVPKNVILTDTWYKELAEQFPLTDIGLYYGDIKEPSRITVTNMQNLDNLNDIGFFNECDFIVWDELHNYMTKRLLAYMKSEKKYKLGLTATIKRKDHRHWQQLALFDFNYFEYGIDTAVKDEILSRFRFNAIGVSLDKDTKTKYDEIDAKIKQYNAMDNIKANFNTLTESKINLINKRKAVLAGTDIKSDVIERIKDDLLGRKSIIFVEQNNASVDLYWRLTGIGFSPCIFNSDIPKDKRNHNLDGYCKDRYDIIITTRALDEGYNLPRIEVAIILGGSSNIRQAIQRIGRSIRKKDNITDIYYIYFKETVDEKYALDTYEYFKNSCEEYKLIDLG